MYGRTENRTWSALPRYSAIETLHQHHFWPLTQKHPDIPSKNAISSFSQHQKKWRLLLGVSSSYANDWTLNKFFKAVLNFFFFRTPEFLCDIFIELSGLIVKTTRCDFTPSEPRRTHPPADAICRNHSPTDHRQAQPIYAHNKFHFRVQKPSSAIGAQPPFSKLTADMRASFKCTFSQRQFEFLLENRSFIGPCFQIGATQITISN